MNEDEFDVRRRPRRDQVTRLSDTSSDVEAQRGDCVPSEISMATASAVLILPESNAEVDTVLLPRSKQKSPVPDRKSHRPFWQEHLAGLGLSMFCTLVAVILSSYVYVCMLLVEGRSPSSNLLISRSASSSYFLRYL